MKKIVALMLGVVLLAAMFAMTGCARKSTVVLTVEGFDADTIVPAQKQNTMGCARQEGPDGVKYIYNGLTDGDYSMLLLSMDGQTSPFTMKIHNGKVEVETVDGVTITATIQ